MKTRGEVRGEVRSMSTGRAFLGEGTRAPEVGMCVVCLETVSEATAVG